MDHEIKEDLKMFEVSFTRPEFELVCDALAMLTAEAQEYAKDPDPEDVVTADQTAAGVERFADKFSGHPSTFTSGELSNISLALNLLIDSMDAELSRALISTSVRASRVSTRSLAASVILRLNALLASR